MSYTTTGMRICIGKFEPITEPPLSTRSTESGLDMFTETEGFPAG